MKKKQYNDKGDEHGYWEDNWDNGKPSYKCFYNNGIEIGYEEWHYRSGNVDKKLYHII